MARDSTWMLAALPTTNTKLYPGQSCPQNRIVDVISFFESGGLAEVFAVFHPILRKSLNFLLALLVVALRVTSVDTSLPSGVGDGEMHGLAHYPFLTPCAEIKEGNPYGAFHSTNSGQAF
jgi:hypothetical protein